MRNTALITGMCLLFPLFCQAGEAEQQEASAGEVGFNLLDSYYDSLDVQLGKKMEVRRRDPFAKAETASPSGGFVPRSTEPLRDAQGKVLNAAVGVTSDMPNMKFQGFMEQKDGKAALLEINGMGTFVVREGDKIGMQQINGTVIRVVEINKLNLTIEIGTLGEKVAKVVVQ